MAAPDWAITEHHGREIYAGQSRADRQGCHPGPERFKLWVSSRQFRTVFNH